MMKRTKFDYNPNGPIFISYRHCDGADRARLIDVYLRSAGLVPWRDTEELPPGRVWEQVLRVLNGKVSAGVLLFTPKFGESDFIRKYEFLPLWNLLVKNKHFSLALVNAIPGVNPKTGEESSSESALEKPDETIQSEDLLRGRYAKNFPKLLRKILSLNDQGHLKTKIFRPLQEVKQYTLLSGKCELSEMTDRLLRERIDRRLLGRSNSLLKIATQTYISTNAVESQVEEAKKLEDYDLVINMESDACHGVPSELSYQCLKETLPLLIKAVHQRELGIELHGGGQHAFYWALGAAFPVTLPQLSGFAVVVVDREGNEEVWADVANDSVGTSSLAAPGEHVKVAEHQLNVSSDPENPRIAVLLERGDGGIQDKPFSNLVKNMPSCGRAIRIKLQKDPVDPTEARLIAQEIAARLRYLGKNGAELHICGNIPVALMAMVARRTNTLNCVVYDFGKKCSSNTKDRYYPAIRTYCGKNPIVEVFSRSQQSADINQFTTFKNHTPHPLRFYAEDGRTLLKELPAESDWVRVSGNTYQLSEVSIDGEKVPARIMEQGELSGEPPRVDGVGYIVSRLSAAAASRPDFFFPYDEVRGEDGSVIGAKGLARFDAKYRPADSLLDLAERRCPQCSNES